jgi:hypothetical protein
MASGYSKRTVYRMLPWYALRGRELGTRELSEVQTFQYVCVYKICTTKASVSVSLVDPYFV